jgi:hypothetical protein
LDLDCRLSLSDRHQPDVFYSRLMYIDAKSVVGSGLMLNALQKRKTSAIFNSLTFFSMLNRTDIA